MRSGQILQFPLSRGLAEDENAKAKPLATLKSGVNIRWPRAGVIGKRFGSAQVGSAVSGLRRFLTRGDELLFTDGDTLWVYDEATDDWIDTGRQVGEVALEWSTIQDDVTGVASSDIAISGDLLVHAWINGDPTAALEQQLAADRPGTPYVQIVNWRTGQVVLPPSAMVTTSDLYTNGPAWHVRVLVAGGLAFVVYSFGEAGGTGTIRAQTVNLTSHAIGAVQTLKSDRRSATAWQGRFDAVFLASGSMAIVYENTTPVLAASRFTNSGGTLSHAATVALTVGSVRCIRIAEDSSASRLYILYGSGGNATTSSVSLRAVNNSTMVSALAATSVRANFRANHVALVVESSTTLLCVMSGVDFQSVTDFSGGGVPYGLPCILSFRTNASAAITAGSYGQSSAMALVSDVFTIGSRKYVFAVDSRYGERWYNDGFVDQHVDELDYVPSISSYLIEITAGAKTHDELVSLDGHSIEGVPHRYVGKIDHDIAGIFQCGPVPHVASIDASTFYAIVPFQAEAAPRSFNWRTGLRLVRATTDSGLVSDPWRSVTLGQECYVAGQGHLGVWDGQTFFDYGMRTPYVKSTDSDATGAMANGSYIYQFMAGYRSHAGILHRSPLSVPVTLDITSPASNGTAWIILAAASIDGKENDVTGYGPQVPGSSFFDTYRSEANGSIVYKLTYEPRFSTTPNYPTIRTIDILDRKGDGDITTLAADGDDDPPVPDVPLNTRPQPYTADGSLEDCQPPAPYSVIAHQGRLVTITGDRRIVWYSKDYKENPNIAPGFNSAQIELYDEKLTAMATMDEKRIMFHERGLFYIVGDGPNVSGLDNRFSPPIPVQSDVGCDNPRSVVSWPYGVIFQSGADLFNLKRDLSVEWISRPARDTLASYPVVTSAALVSDQNEIRFTCNNEAGDAGIVLVFDYDRGTWSTRSYADGAPIVDAVSFGGSWYFATASAVYHEDTSTHLDDGEFVPSTVELEHLGPAGPVGWQRVRLVKPIGQSLSNHALSVSIARDFATTYEQTESFAAGSAVTTIGPYERAEVAPTVQRRQSIGLKFVDASPANTTAYPLGNGAGFQLEGVALLVQPKPGMPRDTSTRRGG